MQFSENVWLEVIKTGLSLLLLAIGWFIGQRIVAYWDIKKKRQELDIATATQFHKLYGEFKEVSRLWRAFKYRQKKLAYPESMPMELQRRAAAAEGELEAIIVKLAVERRLDEDEKKTLGLFRQAYQKLREVIRGDEDFIWTHETPEYKLYNVLASKTAYIIFSKKAKKHRRSADAADALLEITSQGPKAWNEALNDRALLGEGRKDSNAS